MFANVYTLSMCRFNERHDAALEIMASFITQHLPDGYKVMAALPRYQPYVFPLHIATTDQRLDINLYGVIQCKSSGSLKRRREEGREGGKEGREEESRVTDD